MDEGNDFVLIFSQKLKLNIAARRDFCYNGYVDNIKRGNP